MTLEDGRAWERFRIPTERVTATAVSTSRRLRSGKSRWIFFHQRREVGGEGVSGDPGLAYREKASTQTEKPLGTLKKWLQRKPQGKYIRLCF